VALLDLVERLFVSKEPMSITRQASIVVYGLNTPTRWANNFVIDCFDTDPNGVQNPVPIQTLGAPCTWDGASVCVQNTPTYFRGLIYGHTYWFRVGVQTLSQLTSYFNGFYSMVAGTNSSPNGVTYGVVQNFVAGGLKMVLTPQNVASDIDHYEAWWCADNSTPLSTQEPNWRGNVGNDGTFSFHVPIFPSEPPVDVWVRAVNTSHQQETWVKVLGGSATGTLDFLPDGPTFGRVNNDGLTGNRVDPRKTGFIKLGSVNPTWSGTLTWAATSNADGTGFIVWSWPALSTNLTDGTAITSPSNSGYTISGLSASVSGGTQQHYWFYPYVDVTGSPYPVKFVLGGTGSDGSAQTAATNALAAAQSFQSNIPLTSGGVNILMPNKPASGSSGGGGTGGCPRIGHKVESRTRGVINIEDAQRNEELKTIHKGETLWVTVLEHAVLDTGEMVCACDEDGDELHQHPSTIVPLEDDTLRNWGEVSLADMLQTFNGVIRRLSQIWHDIAPTKKVKMTCSFPNTFLCGKEFPKFITHNIKAGPP
jgi:hypothetical protein